MNARQRTRGRPLYQRLYVGGVLILIVGIVSSAMIYLRVGSDADPDRAPITVNQSRYEYDLERVGGKAAVYAARLNDWLASLWHGRPLAYTVLVLSILAALLCFAVARIEASPMQDEAKEDSSA